MKKPKKTYPKNEVFFVVGDLGYKFPQAIVAK